MEEDVYALPDGKLIVTRPGDFSEHLALAAYLLQTYGAEEAAEVFDLIYPQVPLSRFAKAATSLKTYQRQQLCFDLLPKPPKRRQLSAHDHYKRGARDMKHAQELANEQAVPFIL